MPQTSTDGGRAGPALADHAAPVHRHLGLALVVISAAQLMVVLDATIVNIALPSIQRDLHFSSTSLEWVINAYALAFGGLLLLGGRSGDLYGRRRMFVIGIGLFTLASLAGGLAQSETWLIIARAAQGAGGAIASPTALSLIASTFPEGRPRNRAMGVYAAMSGAGAAVGLLLGGVLTDKLDWRWVLFVNVPVGALVALAAPRVLGESERRRGRLDLPGAVSATAGMTLLVYGLTHAATTGWSNSVTIGSLVIAAVLLVAFVAIEARSRHALMPLHIFANRNRSGAYLVMLTVGAAIFAMFFFLTQFVQNILGYSPLKAGAAFLPVSAVIVTFAGISSRLVARVGPRPLMTVGPLAASGGLFWMSHITVHSTYPTILGPMLMIAMGMGTTFVPATLTAVSQVRRDEAGLASALLNTGQQIGGSLGLAVLVTVASTVTSNRVRDAVTALAGHGAAPPGAALPAAILRHAVTSGYASAFRIGALIALAAAVVAAAMVRVRPEELSPPEAALAA